MNLISEFVFKMANRSLIPLVSVFDYFRILTICDDAYSFNLLSDALHQFSDLVFLIRPKSFNKFYIYPIDIIDTGPSSFICNK